jgi:hypothetical protein
MMVIMVMVIVMVIVVVELLAKWYGSNGDRYITCICTRFRQFVGHLS